MPVVSGKTISLGLLESSQIYSVHLLLSQIMFEIFSSQASLLGFGMPGIPEMLIIMAIFLLLFGGAKLPALMRNMGRSVNEFKTGIKEAPADRAIDNESEEEGV